MLQLPISAQPLDLQNAHAQKASVNQTCPSVHPNSSSLDLLQRQCHQSIQPLSALIKAVTAVSLYNSACKLRPDFQSWHTPYGFLLCPDLKSPEDHPNVSLKDMEAI